MSGKRIAREKMTIQRMISLYESQCPQASDEPGHYDALFAYAQKRLDKCVFGEEKPACKQCPVHCYQPAKRERSDLAILCRMAAAPYPADKDKRTSGVGPISVALSGNNPLNQCVLINAQALHARE